MAGCGQVKEGIKRDFPWVRKYMIYVEYEENHGRELKKMTNTEQRPKVFVTRLIPEAGMQLLREKL